MYRSHLTQELLNFFDDADPKVRQGTSTLDAQVLNVFAVQMEEQERRSNWSRDAAYLGTCPLNLDNRGVWNRVTVPPSVGSVAQVKGFIQGAWRTLQPFRSELPVPSRVDLDDSTPPQPARTLTLFETAGAELVQLTPGALDLPNYLYLQAAGLGENFGLVEVLVEGYTYPETPGQQVLSRETVFVGEELPVSTVKIWSTITRIAVRGLPEDAMLRGYVFASALPQVHDVDRPYHHPELRDQALERFWVADGRYLREAAYSGRFSGLETVQSYLCPSPLTSIAVEPNTCGLWATDGSRLYYADRREPMPEQLDQAALVQEPLYSLLVAYETTDDNIRYVTLTPLAGADSQKCHKYRILVELSGSETGKIGVVAPDGAMLDFSPYAGWRSGSPKPITLPVTEDGTYVFTLETADATGTITKDVALYANLYFHPIATFDLSGLVSEIKGIAFDSRQRLLVWDGDQLILLQIHYDAYVVESEANQQFVYMTDAYDKVELS